MDYSWIQILSYVIVPILTLLVVPIFRNLYVRLHTMEAEIIKRVTEAAVRQLLADKLDPLQNDLREIKMQLDQIINRLLDARH